MRYTYTTILTMIGVVLCLVHYVGHENDAIYMLFYAFSVPAWFYPIFTYTNINPLLLYGFTILSWALIGYVADRFAVYRRARGK